MLERGRQHDLALEALDGDDGGQRVRQHLDRHAALEQRVERHEQARHPTGGELALDRVRLAEVGLQGLG